MQKPLHVAVIDARSMHVASYPCTTRHLSKRLVCKGQAIEDPKRGCGIGGADAMALWRSRRSHVSLDFAVFAQHSMAEESQKRSSECVGKRFFCVELIQQISVLSLDLKCRLRFWLWPFRQRDDWRYDVSLSNKWPVVQKLTLTYTRNGSRKPTATDKLPTCSPNEGFILDHLTAAQFEHTGRRHRHYVVCLHECLVQHRRNLFADRLARFKIWPAAPTRRSRGFFSFSTRVEVWRHQSTSSTSLHSSQVFYKGHFPTLSHTPTAPTKHISTHHLTPFPPLLSSHTSFSISLPFPHPTLHRRSRDPKFRKSPKKRNNLRTIR